MEQVRHTIRASRYSRRTEKAYVAWIRRFIFFHEKRHPAQMGAKEIERFLSSLAIDGDVAASTQNQALAALLFLYRKVLKVELPQMSDLVRARRPARLPVVLSQDEVTLVLAKMSGTPRLMAKLLYGGGLRLLECARLRVKDIDFERSQLLIRDAKGQKDRVTVLPSTAREELRAQLDVARKQHVRDLKRGAGFVELPGALVRKLPSAARLWGWQWAFPVRRIYCEKRQERGGGIICTKRCCRER